MADKLSADTAWSTWYLRYLPAGVTGEGEIVAAMATFPPVTVADWREKHPEHFAKSGFYHVLRGTNEHSQMVVA